MRIFWINWRIWSIFCFRVRGLLNWTWMNWIVSRKWLIRNCKVWLWIKANCSRNQRRNWFKINLNWGRFRMKNKRGIRCRKLIRKKGIWCRGIGIIVIIMRKTIRKIWKNRSFASSIIARLRICLQFTEGKIRNIGMWGIKYRKTHLNLNRNVDFHPKKNKKYWNCPHWIWTSYNKDRKNLI